MSSKLSDAKTGSVSWSTAPWWRKPGVREYFEAGVVLVWLIDLKKRTARVFSTVGKSVLVQADESLDGGDVLPGFVVKLAHLLDRGKRPRRG
jgi:Uma2 family endonuclease